MVILIWLMEGLDLSRGWADRIKEAAGQDCQIHVIKDQAPDNHILSKAEIVITSASQTIPLAQMPALKWIHVTSAGINNLPKEILDSDIIVTNSSGVHPIPIAEHVFAFMLMLARQFNVAFRVQIQGKKWMRNHRLLPITELNGKTIGIVGMGRIGRQIARTAKCFEMRVIGLTRDPENPLEEADVQFAKDRVDELLSRSDFVVNCLPLTGETRQLFNFAKFSLMEPTSYFINIGRGGTVVERDLVKALQSGTIAGAGLDVFETEPLPAISPLWNMENVIITPHYAGWTPYYTDRVIDIFCDNVAAYTKHLPMPNLVDKKKGY